MSAESARFAPGRIEYDGNMAAHFDAARHLSPDAAAAWRAALQPFLCERASARVLDLGSGTGRFSTLVADCSAASVIGVEPSHRMRTLAQQGPAHPRVRYVGGQAERIPLRDGCCDVALLSNVFHHVRDQPQCARELRRVLSDGAPLLIKSGFAGRLDGYTLFRYFPEAKAVGEQFPSVEDTVRTFAAAGFTLEGLHQVTQQTCASLQEMAERTRLRADTTLALMHDDDFARRQSELERLAAESGPRPVVDQLDLLVLRS